MISQLCRLESDNLYGLKLRFCEALLLLRGPGKHVHPSLETERMQSTVMLGLKSVLIL